MLLPGVCALAKFAGLDVLTLAAFSDAVKAGGPGSEKSLMAVRQDLQTTLSAVLANPTLLNASFCFPGLSRPRVDCARLVQAFNVLWDTGIVDERLEAHFCSSIMQGIARWAGEREAWKDAPPPLRHKDQLRGLVTLLLCPLVSKVSTSAQSYSLMEHILCLIASLPQDGRTQFISLVTEDAAPVLRSVVVPNVRRFCNAAIRKSGQANLRVSTVWSGLMVLDLLAMANQMAVGTLRKELVTGIAAPHEAKPDGLSRTLSRSLSNVISRTLSGASAANAAGSVVAAIAAGATAEASLFGIFNPAPPVPLEDFQLEILAEGLIPPDLEFMLFMKNAQGRVPSPDEVLLLRPQDERLHSFMTHRRLLPAPFVRRVLQVENTYRHQLQQQQRFDEFVQRAMAGQVQIGPGGQVNMDPSEMFFVLSVRRDHLLEDTSQVLKDAAPSDLQKQIKVTFRGEEGQDAGGVSREFFRLLGEELFSLESQLFDVGVAEEARVLWFDRGSLRDPSDFWLVGVILGLAVYNNLPGLDVRFPVCTFKKLKGEPLTLEDLAEVQPAVAGSFKALLAWQPPTEMCVAEANSLFEDTFCLDFSVSYQERGLMKTVELKEGGKEIAVTLESRAKFVQLYCAWALEGSVSLQFDSFKTGFGRICNSPLSQALTGAELAQIVMGECSVELEQLRPRTRYEGFHDGSEYIAGFWEILQSFDVPRRRRFLSFVTGSDRAPVGGLKELQMLVQRNGGDTERLPSAHTCFNTLLLPEYSSQQRLRASLMTAIENAEGFGLE